MKERIIQEIEKTQKRNEGMLKALVPCWTEIDHNRGYIDGLRYALKLIEKHDMLDKIRAEIENKENELGCKTSEDVAMKTAYIQVLKIIDKYRTESEE